MKMRTVEIDANTVCKLRLIYGMTSYFVVEVISSGITKRFDDVNDAIEYYHTETERLRARATKLLENRYPKPQQTVLAKHKPKDRKKRP